MATHPFLGLLALGPIDPDILQRLQTTLAKFLLLPVRVLPPRPLPMQTYHSTRHQYNAAQLLEFLTDEVETEPFRILGVTAGDLYVPIFTYVFGEGQLDGRAAIISVFRPRGDADGTSPSRRLFLKRLLKLSLHELGHTLGLEHCLEAGCLMEFSGTLEKLDQTNLAFCSYCQVWLKDFLRDQGLLPPLKNAETHAPDASTPTGGNYRRRRQ